MDTVAFLKQVENRISEISYVELKEVFYQIVRAVPADEREAFLQFLPPAQFDEEVLVDQEPLTEFERMYQSVLQIQSGQLSMSSQFNEQFDDWNDEWEELFFFSDYEEIGAILTSAVQWVRLAIERQNWQEGSQLARLLLELEISVEGDYGDHVDEEMGLYQMVAYQLCKIDYPSFLADALYLICRNDDLLERSRMLHQHLGGWRAGVRLEQVFKRGEPLEDLAAFIPFWFNFLAEHGSFPKDNRLLVEAYSMLGTIEEKFATAIKYAAPHPFLLEEHFKYAQKELSVDEYVQRGNESLAHLPMDEPVRSKIALSLSGVVNDQREREELFVEAFKSDRTVVNFLRLFPFLPTQKERLRQLVVDQSSDLQEQKSINQTIFRLLLGEPIASTLPLTKSPSTLPPLFTFCCLFFCQSPNPTPLMNRLLRQMASDFGFSKQDFVRNVSSSTSDEENLTLLWEVLSEWRRYLELPEMMQRQVIQEMANLLDSYVENILSRQERYYYPTCASLIGGLGEVKESIGFLNAKEELVQLYHKKYPRHTSFRKELRQV